MKTFSLNFTDPESAISFLEAKRAFSNSQRRKDMQAEFQHNHLKNKYVLLTSYTGPFKADGTPDKRTKKWRDFNRQNPTFEFVGRRKADVSPDKRTKEWKDFMQWCPSSRNWTRKWVKKETRASKKKKTKEKLKEVWIAMKSIKSIQKELKEKNELTADEKKFLDTHWGEMLREESH